MIRVSIRVSWLACWALVAMGCNKTPTPTPEKETPPPAPSSSAASLAKTVFEPNTEAPPAGPKTFALEPFKPEGKTLQGVFAIEGALMVSADNRKVGRVAGERVEWIGSIPEKSEPFGPAVLDSVHGRYPDAIDTVYRSTFGRAPQFTYFPLTGKGNSVVIAPGGGAGHIKGFAHLGESLLMSTWTPFEGYQFYTVRGPKAVRKHHTIKEAGCKPGEVTVNPSWPIPPPIVPENIAATKAGTMISLGTLCEKRGPAAEVWDKEGKARIVELKSWIKEVGSLPVMLPAPSGDEMFIDPGYKEPVLHYKDGQFEALPLLPPRVLEEGKEPEPPNVEDIFLSPKGEVHAYSDGFFYRFRDNAWQVLGKVAWLSGYRQAAVDENDTLWVAFPGEPGDDETKYWPNSNGEVYRLKEGPSIDFRKDCKTPFVFLYNVKSVNAKNFTFPSTRKALSSFPGVDELQLVEFVEYSERRLGIIVRDQAQGEAVMAHVKATMKDEHPKLLCYQPKNPRVIEMKKGK